MAHIGAIEELQSRGYNITSVSGTSIGSLIGGILAAGKIHEAHQWFCSLDKQQILSLTDFSFSLSHMVKGTKVMDAIKEWVPDRNIEDLPMPAAFVATDILNSREVVFTAGKLFDAIRASISIPPVFEPFQWNDTLLVDGGLTNPFPLNRVVRTPGDILVGMNISAEDKMERGRFSFNHATIINRTIDIQIQAGCRNMTNFCKPDVVAEMPQNTYSTFDFDKAAEIMEKGRELMAKALDEYEAKVKS